MDAMDGVILASMVVLVVLFASVAVLEWWEARTERRSSDQRADAHVIQHPRNDSRASAA